MKYFILSLILIKLLFTVFCETEYNANTSKSSINFQLVKKHVTTDEHDIADIAFSYNIGKGICRHRVINDSDVYIKTSYRPYAQVFSHVYFQKIYSYFIDPLTYNDLIEGKTTLYYTIYGQIMNWATFFLTIISIPFFYRLTKYVLITPNKLIHNIILLFYIITPSTLFFMGSIPLYENISLPCIVIIISIIIQLLNGKDLTTFKLIIPGVLAGFVISIRPQFLIPLLLVFLYLSFLFIFKYHNLTNNKNKLITLILSAIVFISLSISHTVYINKLQWGQYTYSTRGDALLWGHNPLARGSWDASFDNPNSPGYKYQIEKIPNLTTLNEYESSNLKKELAIKNIIASPIFELWLVLKKSAIYFFPYNFMDNRIDFILLFIHLGFIIYCLYFILNIKNEIRDSNRFLCFLIAIGVYLVNIIFFVEYRIRNIADPFMLILAFYIMMFFYDRFYTKKIFNKNINNKPL